MFTVRVSIIGQNGSLLLSHYVLEGLSINLINNVFLFHLCVCSSYNRAPALHQRSTAVNNEVKMSSTLNLKCNYLLNTWQRSSAKLLMSSVTGLSHITPSCTHINTHTPSIHETTRELATNGHFNIHMQTYRVSWDPKTCCTEFAIITAFSLHVCVYLFWLSLFCVWLQPLIYRTVSLAYSLRWLSGHVSVCLRDTTGLKI